MNTEDKAAGAVSIDTPEFRRLAREHHNAGSPIKEGAILRLVAHIDAHAAQRYEAGKREGWDSCALLNHGALRQKNDVIAYEQRHAAESESALAEEQARAEAAEASLARLVEGVARIVRWDRSDDGMVSGPGQNNGRFIEFEDLLALLPAKADNGGAQLAEIAQKPEIPPVGKGDAGGAEPAVTAPAMGEELPPMPEPDVLYQADREDITGHTDDAMRDYGRACMALRQTCSATGDLWQSIETAPKDGRTLLLGCANALGNWRTMRGQWFSAAAIADEWEEPDGADEGWYETAVEPDVPNCWPIAPTHWQPLPAQPGVSTATAPVIQPLEDDGPEFTVDDSDLDALLNAVADYAKGKNQNMDTGLHLMSLLERVQERLKAEPVSQPAARVDRDAVLESAVQAVAERAGDADKLLVLSAFDAIRSLKTNRTALPERHATAPVSQPAMPDLRPVIHWLEGGCDPTDAAKELRAYQKQVGQVPAPAIEVRQTAYPFQQRVQPWLMACFGPKIAGDREERNHRFLEEALELVQACGCSSSEAHQLVNYVFGRDVGEKAQEVGGVMVTLAALCLAQGIDMHAAGETELARIWTKVEAIRAKQAAKPKYSPLPEAPAAAPATRDFCGGHALAVYDPDPPLDWRDQGGACSICGGTGVTFGKRCACAAAGGQP